MYVHKLVTGVVLQSAFPLTISGTSDVGDPAKYCFYVFTNTTRHSDIYHAAQPHCIIPRPRGGFRIETEEGRGEERAGGTNQIGWVRKLLR